MAERTLLFTDVVESTRLVERLGDARAAAAWIEHDRRARDLLARHRGREIDRTDGFFLLFESAADAARYALDYHACLADLGMAARAGLHHGAVSLRENPARDVALGAKPLEVDGLAKPLAARITALAGAGQTLLSEAARAALNGALPDRAELAAHGHYRLKGIETPVEVFELGMRGTAPFAPPADTDHAYRVFRSGELWRPTREVRHNLAAERDAFVGRVDELHWLATRFEAGARLVTVVGAGGSGKTRLVHRFALQWLGDWPGGVWFCDLSEARSLDGICFVVASALGVPLGKGDAVVQLGHALAARGRCLVILDNFEQVADHAGASLGRWLDRAPGAAFAITSRERLHLKGEAVLPLEPLPLASAAVELFCVRARAQQPAFAATAENRAAIERIVSLLDGLPLAIELAAARINVLSPAQLADRMRRRFETLAASRGQANRQATLRAAIDWSWELLADWERGALAQCSVFEGGFTLEAAENVIDLAEWPSAPSVMEAVQALVDKSLLRTWLPAESARYALAEPYFGMYLSIHEYAAERLAARGEQARLATERRHGIHFAAFGGDDALEQLYRHGGVARRRALGLELDNLFAACTRALARGAAEIAVPTFRAAWEVLELRGPFAPVLALAPQVLALESLPPALRLRAGVTLGVIWWRSGRLQEAGEAFDEMLALARAAGDEAQQGRIEALLGNIRYDSGRLDLALGHYERAIGIHARTGNRRLEAFARTALGRLHLEQGRIDTAREQLELSLQMHREVGNRIVEGNAVGMLANLTFEQGHVEAALALHEQALAIYREVGNRRDEGVLHANLGSLRHEQGRLDEARRHYEDALVVARDVGYRVNEAVALANLGSLLVQQRRHAEARVQLANALVALREVGNRRFEAFAISCIGELSYAEGRLEEAVGHFEQALEIHRSMSNLRYVGHVLAHVAEVRVRQGDLAAAGELLREAEALLRDVGDRIFLGYALCVRARRELAAGHVEAARALLGEAQALATEAHAGPESEMGRHIAAVAVLLAGPAEAAGR